jgi:hypothetical protein
MKGGFNDYPTERAVNLLKAEALCPVGKASLLQIYTIEMRIFSETDREARSGCQILSA